MAYQAAARERDYRALLARGDAALRDDQTFGAIEAYSGAMALRPDSMLAHLRRGETYQRRGELDAAARDFRTAAALDPTATRPLEAWATSSTSCSGSSAPPNLRERPDARRPLGPVSYKLALARYRAGDIDGAPRRRAERPRADDRLAEAYYLLGLCLRERRRNAEAKQAFEKAVALSPGLHCRAGRAGRPLRRARAAAPTSSTSCRSSPASTASTSSGRSRSAWRRRARATPSRPCSRLATRSNARPISRSSTARSVRSGSTRPGAQRPRLSTSRSKRSSASAPARSDERRRSPCMAGRSCSTGRSIAPSRRLEQATTRFPVDPSAFLFYATAAERQNHLDAARQALIDYSALVADDASWWRGRCESPRCRCS